MPEIYSYVTKDVYVHHTIDFKYNALPLSLHDHKQYHQYEIYCFLRGSGHYVVENTRYRLQPGAIVIMREDEIHGDDIEDNCTYERLVVQFSAEIIPRFSLLDEILVPFNRREKGAGNLYLPKDFPIFNTYALLKEIARPQAQNNDAKHITLISNLPALLYQIYSAHSSKVRNSADIKSEDVFLSLLDYVNTHIFDDLSLTTICDRLFVSKSHIEKIFRKKTGSSVAQYIAAKRLMEAQRMIQTGVTATIASEACGFKTYSTFYRAYNKYFGNPPSLDILRNV